MIRQQESSADVQNMNNCVISCFFFGGVAAYPEAALKFSATDPVLGEYGLSVEHRLNDAFPWGRSGSAVA